MIIPLPCSKRMQAGPSDHVARTAAWSAGGTFDPRGLRHRRRLEKDARPAC
jgi:hypothetical protein